MAKWTYDYIITILKEKYGSDSVLFKPYRPRHNWHMIGIGTGGTFYLFYVKAYRNLEVILIDERWQRQFDLKTPDAIPETIESIIKGDAPCS